MVTPAALKAGLPIPKQLGAAQPLKHRTLEDLCISADLPIQIIYIQIRQSGAPVNSPG